MDYFRQATDVETFPAGTVVIDKGSPGDRMFVVQHGEVEIRVGDAVLETVPEGGFFGEMALIDHSPRSATVVAKTDVRLVPLNEKRFLRCVQDTPGFALTVMRSLATRLRNMDAHA